MKKIDIVLICATCVLLTAGPVLAEEPKPDTAPKPAAAAVQTADWTQIFRDLNSDDMVVRESAAKSYAGCLEEQAKNSKKPYFTEFKKSLMSAEAKDRESALKSLLSITRMFQNDARHFPELLKDLNSPDIKVRTPRLEIIYKATEIQLQAECARGFIEKLGEDDKAVVEKAIEQLKLMKGDAAEELANGLDDEKVAVKKTCAEMLRELGPDGKEAVSTLVFKLRDEDDKFGRKLAVQVLEQLGPNAAEAIDDLVMNLDDSDKILRRLSANVLKSIGPAYKSAVGDLVNYLTHDEKSVRAMATELLLPLGPKAVEGVKDLVEIIDEPNAPPATPVDPKVPAAQPNDTDSKVRAANILAAIGPAAKDALPGLKKYANAPEAELKDAVNAAISAIEKVEAVKEEKAKEEKK